MWVPGESLLWSITDESPVSLKSDIWQQVEQRTEVSNWQLITRNCIKVGYEMIRQAFMISTTTLIASYYRLRKVLNANRTEFSIFYWFDVDRTKKEDFVWEKSPCSGNVLFDLGPDYHFLNRLVSTEDHMVFLSIGKNITEGES